MISIHWSSTCPSNYSRFNVIIDYVIINHFGMHANSLTPKVNCWNRVNKSKVWINNRLIVFKKSWHRLRIKEIIKSRRFCKILKRLNVINVNSVYCVKRVNFLFCLRFINYKDVLFKNYDLRSSDVKQNSILTSKFDILRFNGFHDVYVFF